ncbi:MAG: ATP-binding cassette domain-containing protein [Phycisphaerae bacterium]
MGHTTASNPSATVEIEIEGAFVRFGSTDALSNVSLQVTSGKTVALIGQSGCGKSTLLRSIIGLVRLRNGRVYVRDQIVCDENIREIRRLIGYVIQEGGLFPHLTARQNVALVPQHLKWQAARIDSRVRELADLVSIPVDALDRYPTQLSGGQRQRVSLMRALVLDPAILLLDEPLGALDPIIRSDLQVQLKNIFSRLGKTVVIVTHDLSEAAHFADDIVLMRNGTIAQRGTIADLTEQPADEFVATFIASQHSAQIGHAEPKK